MTKKPQITRSTYKPDAEPNFDPASLMDREVVEAFATGRARLYVANVTTHRQQFIVIDGGKNAKVQAST